MPTGISLTKYLPEVHPHTEEALPLIVLVTLRTSVSHAETRAENPEVLESSQGLYFIATKRITYKSENLGCR